MDDELVPTFSPPDAFLPEVGRLVLAAGRFEEALAFATYKAAGDRVGVLVAGLSFDQLTHALRALVERHQPEQLEAVNPILNAGSTLQQDRNHIVHGRWLFHAVAASDGRRSVALRPRRWRNELQGKIFEPGDVTRLSESYDALSERLNRWTSDVWPDH